MRRQITAPVSAAVPVPERPLLLGSRSFGRFSSAGRIFVTTFRIVFVPNRPSIQNGVTFDAFDIPIKLVRNERFNQPIFGANNMTGIVAPISEVGLLVDTRWKLVFKEGGVGTFLPIFLRMMDQFRRAMEQGDTSECSSLLWSVWFLMALCICNAAWQDGAGAREFYRQMQSRAYVDPSDPSTIFVQQPDTEA